MDANEGSLKPIDCGGNVSRMLSFPIAKSKIWSCKAKIRQAITEVSKSLNKKGAELRAVSKLPSEFCNQCIINKCDNLLLRL